MVGGGGGAHGVHVLVHPLRDTLLLADSAGVERLHRCVFVLIAALDLQPATAFMHSAAPQQPGNVLSPDVAGAQSWRMINLHTRGCRQGSWQSAVDAADELQSARMLAHKVHMVTAAGSQPVGDTIMTSHAFSR